VRVDVHEPWTAARGVTSVSPDGNS
jgi:hypothetical protein